MVHTFNRMREKKINHTVKIEFLILIISSSWTPFLIRTVPPPFLTLVAPSAIEEVYACIWAREEWLKQTPTEIQLRGRTQFGRIVEWRIPTGILRRRKEEWWRENTFQPLLVHRSPYEDFHTTPRCPSSSSSRKLLNQLQPDLLLAFTKIFATLIQ